VTVEPTASRASPAAGYSYDNRVKQLEETKRQATVDMDFDTVNEADKELKSLRSQEGRQTLGDRLGDVVGASASGTVGGIANTLSTLWELAGGDPSDTVLSRLSDRGAEGSARFTHSAKAGLGKAGQFLTDTGIAGMNLLTDAAVNTLVPGAGLAMTGVRSFGNAAREAAKDGASVGQQAAYGLGSAVAGVLTEKLANTSGLLKSAYGSGFLKDPVVGTLGRLAYSAVSEGAEEFAEGLAQPLLKRFTYDPEAVYDDAWLYDTLYDSAVGAALGGLAGAADAVTDGTDITAKEKAYVGEIPRNVAEPAIKSPNLTAAMYLKPGAAIETAYGNKYRKLVENNAERRLGIGPNKPAYLVASNVTKDGETYYAKVTRESLGKMLYTEKQHKLPIERLLLVDNLEKVFDNSVWVESRGDRKNRTQIDGFDTLRTSFYVDGQPYYADIVVKVVRPRQNADSENVIYFLEPETVKITKK